jgi:excisionase family DNA binding protein
MQAYGSAQLAPLEPESLCTAIPPFRPTRGAIGDGGMAAQPEGASNPIANLASPILDGLSEHDLRMLACRLLPHLRQPTALTDGGVHAAYTVGSLAAELGVSQKTIRCAIARRELAAVKRGARWLISADAVHEWATPSEVSTRRPSRCATTPKAAGPSLRSVLCAVSGSGGRR